MNDIYVTLFSDCSVAMTATDSNPAVASVTPTSATFANGSVELNIVALTNGTAMITVNYTLSGTSCQYQKQYVDSLNVQVGGPNANAPPITGLANNYSFVPNGFRITASRRDRSSISSERTSRLAARRFSRFLCRHSSPE